MSKFKKPIINDMTVIIYTSRELYYIRRYRYNNILFINKKQI